jgi:hypothetical protein
MNLKQLSSKLAMDQMYVRKLVVSGKIESTIVPIKEGSKVMRHEISDEAVEKFLKTPRKSITKREDGRNKFVVYLTSDEFKKVDQFLKKENIPSPVKTVNKKIKK